MEHHGGKKKGPDGRLAVAHLSPNYRPDSIIYRQPQSVFADESRAL
jgi:hypothetical protein